MRQPDYRLLEYGNDITIGSNAVSPNIDFSQHIMDTMRRKQASPRTP